MTHAEKVSEWLHTYSLLQSDEAKWQLFAHLKRSGDKAALDALDKMMTIWLREK